MTTAMEGKYPQALPNAKQHIILKERKPDPRKTKRDHPNSTTHKPH